METAANGSLFRRMKGAALLDVGVYEEVEADSSATTQAAIVVAIVAVAQAIGGAGEGGAGALTGVIGAILAWLLWAGVTYLIGDKVLGGTATWGELLRTIGFAQSPGVLFVFGIIPLLGGIVRLVVALWILVTGIVAIRQALDFGTGKAVLTAFLGWLAVALVTWGLGSMLM